MGFYSDQWKTKFHPAGPRGTAARDDIFWFPIWNVPGFSPLFSLVSQTGFSKNFGLLYIIPSYYIPIGYVFLDCFDWKIKNDEKCTISYKFVLTSNLELEDK